ncbi:MAG: CbtB-domain containing protein [Patulibacter sp.]
MATSLAPQTGATPQALADAKDALWYGGALFLALVIFYFVGVDQGATSLFGSDTHIHEWVHDARHFLGFPCH